MAKEKAHLRKIYAIGHSTRSIEEFIALLQAHEIELLIDIRSIPRSRHNPQFDQENLALALKEHHIGYRHIKGLGGLRHPLKDSINTGWVNASFRGFADYMQTPAFQKALESLEKIGEKKRCALMCAEAMPWRCHRSLILDVLTLHHWKAFHIQSRKTAKRHVKTSFLRTKKGIAYYQN